MAIYFKRALMHAGWQRRIKALSKAFGHDKFTGNLLELHVRLERLQHVYEAVDTNTRSSTTYLQKLFQKRDTVRPFMYVVEGVQTLLYLLRILLKLRVRRIHCLILARSSIQEEILPHHR